ncbi:hypothetical protein FHT44_004922 [Mycolicibacterium sp. BK634]|nr:hypothetical protein [Mycolicibacterium sp. BK634]
MTDSRDPALRWFFAGTEISEEKALWLEDSGQAHVAQGSSGGARSLPVGEVFTDDEKPDGPWCLMKAGPGNVWIEKREGDCPECGQPWKTHLRPVWVRKDKDHRCVETPPLTICPFCGEIGVYWEDRGPAYNSYLGYEVRAAGIRHFNGESHEDW